MTAVQVESAAVVRPRGPVDEEDAGVERSAARASFDLVYRFQAGDPEAFGLIWRAYHVQVHQFIQRRTGNRWLAEDLTQDVFVRALRRLDRVEWQGRDLAAWLHTVARNLVADHFKSGRFRLEVLADAATDATRPSEEPGPEDQVVSYLEGRDALESVLLLTGEQREVLILRFLRGLSVAEAAASMGKTANAVKALQFRATRTLARAMEARG